MYIIPTCAIDPQTQTAYYSALAGRYAGQRTLAGYEPTCTEIRGYLLAISLGFRVIAGLHGSGERFKCDVLMLNVGLGQMLIDQMASSTLLSPVDRDLWTEFLDNCAKYEVRVVARHSDSQAIQTLWAWSEYPYPARAELPAGH
jgi:hypothetical protein